MAVNIGINVQRSPNRINQALRAAGVNGQYPKLLFDFNDDYYLTNGSSKSFTEAMTFARAGNATMVDSDGKIKWAPHNVIPYSQEMDNATWFKQRIAVTANATTAPDGTLTADKLTENSEALTRFIVDSGGDFASGTIATAAVFMKSAERSAGFLQITDASSPARARFQAIVDLSNGTIVSTQSSTSPAPLNTSSSISSVGNGWYLVKVSMSAQATGNMECLFSPLDGTSYTTILPAYQGDGSSGIYAWGAHLYRSDLGGMAPIPLSQRSFKADAYYEPDKPAIQAALLRAAVNLEPEKTLFNIEVNGRKLGDVNNDGTVSSADALEYTRYVAGDMTYSTYIETVMHPYMVENSTTYLAYLDERSSAYYVPTTSSAVYMPRLRHHVYNGDQWVNKGILVESEARTNVVDYSNYFNNATTNWVYSALSVTHDATTSPDGTTSAASMSEDASANIHSLYQIGNLPIGTGTGSFYVKPNGRDYCQIRVTGIGTGQSYVNFDLQNGVLGTSGGTQLLSKSIEPAGNGWYRISMTVNGTYSFGFELCLVTSASAIERQSYTGDGTSGIYVYGAQFEQASTPSSYIPTNGATVTRAAETVTVPYANLPWPTPTYIGDELVTNGTFDTDTSGWTAANGGVLSVNNGAIRVTEDGVDGSTARAYQTITTEIGKVYLLSLDLVDTSDNFEVYVNTNPNYGGAIASSSTETDPQTLTLPFVATATTTYIIIGAGSPSTGIYSEYDNISVREINPLSVSIAMMGEMNYADEDASVASTFVQWEADSNNSVILYRRDSITGNTGEAIFFQKASGVIDFVASGSSTFTPDLNVPFNIASRHGSTFINGAVDGTAITADTTPTALPDLSTTDLNLAYDFMGTISEFRIFDRDIGDTGIAEATKPSLEPSLSLTFDGQPSSFTNSGLTV